MVTLAFLAAAALASQDTAIFKDDQLRLTFSYPKTWSVVKGLKDTTTLSLPIENSTERAKLEIMRAAFHSETEIWQTVQLHANRQLQRDVVRQWQEEILGVPLLLTLIRYSDKGVSMNTVTGLLYTRTPLKMLYRLTAPESDFENVQFAFTTALQTLRAADEDGLKPENPNLPPVEPPKKVEKIDTRPPKKTTFTEQQEKQELVQGPVVVDLEVSGRKMQARLPKGWTFEEVKGNHFVAKHPSLSGGATIDVYSLIDSDPPRNALFKKATESLTEFTKVAKREDLVDKTTRSGMNLNAVFRIGDGPNGKRFALDGSLVNDTHYALVQFRSDDEDDRRLIDELLMVLSVAPTP